MYRLGKSDKSKLRNRFSQNTNFRVVILSACTDCDLSVSANSIANCIESTMSRLVVAPNLNITVVSNNSFGTGKGEKDKKSINTK